MSSETPVPLQTFVFFDLEATGLTRPRITELCLLSVQREELLTSHGFPRVVNKLTLCVDPQKAIEPTASNITGLYNDILESQTSFDQKVVEIMTLFLSRLPKPVCLVAHYGNGFDYPLLNAELKRIKCELPLEVLCVDSLDAIRAIDTKALYEEEVARRDIQNQNNSTPTHQGIKQNARPNHSRTFELQQDTLHDKRKADTDSINHVRKRLFIFSDADIKAKDQQHSGDIKPGPSTSVVPALSKPGVEQSNSHSVQNVKLPSAEVSLMMDSQQSVTDDMLMEAVDFVEANGSSETGTVSPSGATVPGTKVDERCDGSGAGKDGISLPGTSDPVTKNNGMCRSQCGDKLEEKVSNSTAPHQADVKDDTGKSTSIDQTPVTPSNTTPASTGVNVCNNNITPVTLSNTTPASTGVNVCYNNITPVTPSNTTPASTGVNVCYNNITPVTTSASDQGQTTSPIILPRLSYKLEQIYFRTFGVKPPLSHNAEDDCITLMKVCKKRCPQFLEWADKHKTSLSCLQPLYGP